MAKLSPKLTEALKTLDPFKTEDQKELRRIEALEMTFEQLVKLYPLVYAWHTSTGSLSYYIRWQMQDAYVDCATSDVIYKSKETDGWEKIGSVVNPETINRVCRTAIYKLASFNPA